MVASGSKDLKGPRGQGAIVDVIDGVHLLNHTGVKEVINDAWTISTPQPVRL